MQNLAYYGKLYGSYGLDYEALIAAGTISMMSQRTVTVLDVGANKGDYSSLLVRRLPQDAAIHCFEPSVDHRPTLESLERQHADKIHFHPVGLSSQVGTTTLFKDRTGSGLASLYERDIACHGLKLSQREVVDITTLDQWCSVMGIDEISFMKVDVEGHELDVFNGGQNMLGSGRINALQFELGGCNIDSRTYLKDFHSLLARQYGYLLYRLAPGKRLVDLNSYRESSEFFSWQNICAFRLRTFIPRDFAIINEY
jgi:FkbM family methyltransferase